VNEYEPSGPESVTALAACPLPLKYTEAPSMGSLVAESRTTPLTVLVPVGQDSSGRFFVTTSPSSVIVNCADT
jgi:hypothetical protein